MNTKPWRVIGLRGHDGDGQHRPRFVEQGVWIRPFKDVVYLMPPLVIGDEDLDILTGAIRTVLGALET